jgi:prefoldin subunit 5
MPMRTLAIRALAGLAIVSLATSVLEAQETLRATAVQPVPAEMNDHYVRIHARLQPSAKIWVKDQARAELKRPAPDVGALEATTRTRFAASGLSSTMDIDALIYVVLMESVNDMASDLQQQMSAMQALTAAKAQLRQLLDQVNQDIAALTSASPSTPCKTSSCQSLGSHLTAVVTQCRQSESKGFAEVASNGTGYAVDAKVSGAKTVGMMVLGGSGPPTKGELDQVQRYLTNQLNGMNDLSDEMQTELQMITDRRSKLLEAMSNLMKTTSDANQAMIANLK